MASSFDVYPSNPLDKAATMYKDHKKSYNANTDKISYKGMMKQDVKVKSFISLNIVGLDFLRRGRLVHGYMDMTVSYNIHHGHPQQHSTVEIRRLVL